MLKSEWMLVALVFAFFPSSLALRAGNGSRSLEEYVNLGDNQPTGIAVSSTGRIFVTFPRWDVLAVPTVAELIAVSGSSFDIVPYPNVTWNSWREGDSPKDRFVSAQSVFIDQFERLWILDPAAPYFGPAVPGGPKLVQVDLKTNKIVQIIELNSDFAPATSYLNDVRFNKQGTHAYITDSNLGHLIVVDLVKNNTKRVILGSHFSAKAEREVVLEIEGTELRLEDGSVFTVQADGIAVVGDYCYYHVISGRTLYRIHTKFLDDPSYTECEIIAAVERVRNTGYPDGLITVGDSQLNGQLFTTNLETNGIDLIDDDQIVPIVAFDERLQWPDSLSYANGYIYVTASQIHLLPRFNRGVSQRTRPYAVYRVKI